jgi:hypothetical protein
MLNCLEPVPDTDTSNDGPVYPTGVATPVPHDDAAETTFALFVLDNPVPVTCTTHIVVIGQSTF